VNIAAVGIVAIEPNAAGAGHHRGRDRMVVGSS
jgi:hypothetical protein